MRAALLLPAVLLAAGLSACDSADEGEIQRWMQEQRAQTKPQVAPIAEPKNFTPQAYTQEGGLDPFSNQKLAAALKQESQQGASQTAKLIAPELNRRKEPLESYPLDAMTMVGSLVKQGQPVALVKVDNLLYQVRPGNYLGQNYGRITKVGEVELVLRELVQDAAGEWIERTATLQLQEKGK
jgi:type IV pilus assembly protein PilP